uniref:Zmp:0000001267 n=1 Tax=Mola mola TaxID=94237 RepID=A0A3Q3VTN8_MOLML
MSGFFRSIHFYYSVNTFSIAAMAFSIAEYTEKKGLNLKREVGIIGAVSFIAGTMMGSGIFISPIYVLSAIGSTGASLVIWACCGLVVMMGGLCYAELGTVIPESGGEFIYILWTVGRVVAFMFVFSFIVIMRPASATGIVEISFICTQYAYSLIFCCLVLRGDVNVNFVVKWARKSV